MGERPEGTSLDRIDSDGNYCPSNCRWADKFTQSRNRDYVIRVTHDGRTQTLTEWAEELGISRKALQQRIKRGWKVERALTQPQQHH
jgi:hypothetical protein